MPRALSIEELQRRDAENKRIAEKAIARAEASSAALANKLEKDQTRRKILVGAVVSAACEEDITLKQRVDELLRAKLTRKDDRALFRLDSPEEPASPVRIPCAKDDVELRTVLKENGGKWIRAENVWKVDAGAKADAVAAFLAARDLKENEGGGAQVRQADGGSPASLDGKPALAEQNERSARATSQAAGFRQSNGEAASEESGDGDRHAGPQARVLSPMKDDESGGHGTEKAPRSTKGDRAQ